MYFRTSLQDSKLGKKVAHGLAIKPVGAESRQEQWKELASTIGSELQVPGRLGVGAPGQNLLLL